MTENYAIFFLYPISIDMGCATMHLLHDMLQVSFKWNNYQFFKISSIFFSVKVEMFQCVRWHGDNTESLIFVVNLKTGETTNGIKTEAIYSTHHVNAYEVTENELNTVVVDLVIPPW